MLISLAHPSLVFSNERIHFNSAITFHTLHHVMEHDNFKLSHLADRPLSEGSESYIYEIIISLGEQGPNKPAVIKLMKDIGSPENLMVETKHEYGVMLNLNKHFYPYVPELYAGLYFTEPIRGPAILMRKYEGDLTNIAGQLDKDKFHRLAFNVVDAVNKLHEHGLVHRDLKPENILYRDRKDQSIVLTDYRSTSAIGIRGKYTFGNPSPAYWMPQCSWLDKEDDPRMVDPQEDLFSLGLSLFYIKYAQYLQQFLFTDVQWEEISTASLMIKHYEDAYLKNKASLLTNFPDEIDQMLIMLASPRISDRPNLRLLRNRLKQML